MTHAFPPEAHRKRRRPIYLNNVSKAPDIEAEVSQGSLHLSKPAPAPFMSRYVEILLATACGLAVASIYYAHPLLDALANEFTISHSSIGIVITVTQICYALGLLLLVPLGDLLNRRQLIPIQMLLSVFALIVVGFSPTSTVLLIGMAMVGLLAVVTQVLVAFAATLAVPAERGRVVGLVTSGVVIGILLARAFAGIVTDLAGWRSVYLVSATALTLLLISWLPISYTKHSLLALIIGVVLLDLAVQAVHVTNQSMIFTVRPEARSRLTAGYMIFYSIGSATGSIASTNIYAYAGWIGVCLLGATVSALALLFWALTLHSPHRK